ncbi:putative Helix-destabilizing protein [Herminiimonas arsenicoxydans]|uniref:Single-stranded DNA-binding protein n=1 Tax=Herminiimonas arsenicoxydans TaxID=204773 RepID=A4G5A0_HERAR|nr:putative Helix-destabilizing protein [Herminiimonas arsenicoxydans]
MTIKIVVEEVNVDVKTGVGAKGPWRIEEQEVFAYLADRKCKLHAHPTRITVRLEDGQLPYPIGEYTISPNSFYAGKYNSLMFSARLVPMRAAVK